MDEPRHWLLSSLLPSIQLNELLGSETYEDACSRLDPSCGGSLLRLLDARRGSKRSIEYLTPSVKLSQVFRVRFTAPTDLGIAKESRSIDNALFQAVASQKPDRRKNDTPFPWFSLFRRTLFQSSNSWKEIADETGNLLYQPLVILFAIYAGEVDPVARCAQLLTDRDQYAQAIPKAYLVIATENTAELQVETTLKLLHAEFGSDSVFLLKLHSEKAFEETFHDLMTKMIMVTQKRIFALNDVVSSQKKGLTNTFRSLFGGNTSGSGKNSHQHRTGKGYSPDSLQFKVRSLADLLFWMRDYDAALVYYSYARDDYQRDEAFMHMGNSLEMIAVCLFLSKGVPGSVEEGTKRVELIDRAVESYFRSVVPELKPTASSSTAPGTKKTQLGYRLATRASLLLLDIAPRNVASSLKVLMKSLAHEDELCAAVLLEQISLLMLEHTGLSRKGMFRRSDFNLLHAGSLFRSLGLDHHAFRCYSLVHESFYRKGWVAAEHHLEVNLGNFSRNLGDLKSLIEYRGCSLERGYEIVNSSQHTQLLKEFCDAIDKLPVSENQKPLRYQIPRITSVSKLKDHSDDLLEEDERCFAGEWTKLDEYLFVVSKSKRRRSTKKEAFVNEPLFIDVAVSNPLSCELSLFDFNLVPFPENASQISLAPLPEVKLRAKERRIVRLGLIPQQECVLKLRGLSWKLTPNARVESQFDFNQEIFVIDVLQKAACLRPIRMQRRGAQTIDTIEYAVELENVGALQLDGNSALLIAMPQPGLLEWSLESSARVAPSIVDDRGLVVNIDLPRESVQPGGSLSLTCKVLKVQGSAYRCAVMSSNGRVAHILVPAIHDVTPDLTSLVCKANANVNTTKLDEQVLVVGIDSTSGEEIRPLGVLCFSPGWCIEDAIDEEGKYFPSSLTDTKWSLVIRLKESDTEASSFVALDPSYARSGIANEDPKLSPSEFGLRSCHADQIHQERLVLKSKYERVRAELEAKGQLPISIQDVRRARQRGDLVLEDPSTSLTKFLPGSIEALSERKNLIHIAIDYVAKGTVGSLQSAPRVQRCYVTRIPVSPPTITIQFKHPIVSPIWMARKQDMCELPLTLRIANVSASETVANVNMIVGDMSGGLHDRFPRPAYWLGPTRKAWSNLGPGEYKDIPLTAVFLCAGVYTLGPVVVEYARMSGELTSEAMKEETFVSVFREEMDDQELFDQVEKELMEG